MHPSAGAATTDPGPGPDRWSPTRGGEMLIECDRCEMRDIACPDCVVTALLADGEPVADLDAAERRALRGLADARLVAPLLLRPSATLRPPAPRYPPAARAPAPKAC